ACETQFSFHYPPENDEKIIVARVLRVDAGRQSLGVGGGRVKTCSKCGHENTWDAGECSYCQVVFEKLRDLPLGKVRASGNLIKIWTDLVLDFGDQEKHLAFISQGERENCLEFCELRYKQYLEIQAFDETAQNYLRLVRLRHQQTHKEEEKPTFRPSFWLKNMEVNKLKTLDWKKLSIKMSPYFCGILMILVGFFIGGLRNLVGIGAAFLILWTGLSLYLGDRFNGLPRK
ncbi:MAG: hypothetical protein AB7H97_05765, partial [Pseudobdellovibrionaceae bacterium]